MSLTPDDLKMLVALQSSPIGQRYLEFLRRRRSEADAAMRAGEGAPLHRAQGRAQTYDELVGEFETAREQILRVSTPKVRQLA